MKFPSCPYPVKKKLPHHPWRYFDHFCQHPSHIAPRTAPPQTSARTRRTYVQTYSLSPGNDRGGFAGAVYAAEPTFGQTFTWNNPAGGTFSTATNWSPTGPPALATQTALFNLNNTYTVDFTAGASHGTFIFNRGNVSFLSAAGTLYNVSTATFNGGKLNLSSTGASMILAPSGIATINPGARINIEANGFFSPLGNVTINGGSIFRSNNPNDLQPADGTSAPATDSGHRVISTMTGW